MGINVNDRGQRFTELILSGGKTIETRRSASLAPYVGRRVGIVRTGTGVATLVGYATIGEPVRYLTLAAFRAAEPNHLVPAGSEHDWTPAGKYGYPLSDVVPCRPRPIHNRGIVARRIR